MASSYLLDTLRRKLHPLSLKMVTLFQTRANKWTDKQELYSEETKLAQTSIEDVPHLSKYA